MGSNITIDKHTSSLDHWLEIQKKLTEIQFQATPHTHLSIWKIFLDQLDHSANLAPLPLNAPHHQLFASDECYVVGLVRRDDYTCTSTLDSQEEELIVMLRMIRSTVDEHSYRMCVKEGTVKIQGRSKEKVKFFTYAFTGKKSPNSLKISALSYAYKLGRFLNNEKRLKVLSGGGVYRNKKLQMGSIVPLCPRHQGNSLLSSSISNQNNTDLYEQFQDIHLVNQLTHHQRDMDEGILPIFRYEPKMAIPVRNVEKKSRKRSQEMENESGLSRQDFFESSSEKFNPTSGINGQNRKGQQNYQHESSEEQSSSLANSRQIQPSSTLKQVPPMIPKLASLSNPKPPMLKLALKEEKEEHLTFETYDQLKEHEKNNNEFEMRDTARHELKMQKFSNDCSMIIEGLYLSGEKIAKSESILRQHRITEIVNCAGDYCENWFEKVHEGGQRRYNYLTFFLKDSQHENIECLFYRVIDFINTAHRSKKNVLIHCIQGISRSVTFVIAYLIFMNGFDYKKAESFVKERRAIACPNNGFMVELIQFHKRLYEDYDSLSIHPRVFLVSPHRQQTPQIITARMIKTPLFDSKKKYLGLDTRGMYIVQCKDVVFLWVGSQCSNDEGLMKKYWNYSQEYIRKLQEHEKAALKVKAISEGKEGRDFMGLWGIEEVPSHYQCEEYSKLFDDMSPTPIAGHLRKFYEREEEKEEDSSPDYQSRLFIYPDSVNGLGVFELDDLVGFCLVVKSNAEGLKIFIWREGEGEGKGEEREGEFLDRVIEDNYMSYEQENIEIVEESSSMNELSEEFLNCFS